MEKWLPGIRAGNEHGICNRAQFRDVVTRFFRIIPTPQPRPPIIEHGARLVATGAPSRSADIADRERRKASHKSKLLPAKWKTPASLCTIVSNCLISSSRVTLMRWTANQSRNCLSTWRSCGTVSCLKRYSVGSSSGAFCLPCEISTERFHVSRESHDFVWPVRIVIPCLEAVASDRGLRKSPPERDHLIDQ